MSYQNSEETLQTSLQKAIATDGFFYFPSLFSKKQVSEFNAIIQELPSRRVRTSADDRGTYLSQKIRPATARTVWNTFLSRSWINILRNALGLAANIPLYNLEAWTHHYQLGEFIGPHTDIAGDIQVVIALQTAPPENGGTLFIQTANDEQGFDLAPGDGVIFKANQLTHYSTPLVSTASLSTPVRTVIVARYYFHPY